MFVSESERGRQIKTETESNDRQAETESVREKERHILRQTNSKKLDRKKSGV